MAANPTVEVWKERIRQAKDARRPYEPGMLLNLAFAAGQHWVVYDRRQHRVRSIREVDPRFVDRELFTADRITEYRDAMLAELNADDDRPVLLAAQEGETAEKAAEQLNLAAAYAWEHEWDADQALRRARRYCVDMGYAAVRCRWDPNRGKPVGNAPIGADGHPITDRGEHQHLIDHGTLSDGSLPKFRPVREGATIWEAYSPLQLLTPPGGVHEDDFPWEIIQSPVLLDDVQGAYPGAGSLVEDPDIASTMGVPIYQQGRSGQFQLERLRGFVWLYRCFERPSRQHPQGAVAIIASNQYVLLDEREGLDYQDEQERPASGITYLHFRRRSDRFQSASFIENMRDPQRIINRRESQNVEIIDRHMPRHYVHQGDLPEDPAGDPGEIVRLADGAPAPTFFQGAGPGSWMYDDINHQADNLSHSSTLSALKLGENPPGVQTYAQLVTLNEAEQMKRSETRLEHRAAIGQLETMSMQDIARYWPDEKQILVSGNDDQLSSAIFQKAGIPARFMARRPNGAPLPRSQGAEVAMLDAIWAAAVQAWVAVNDGQTWVEWYADSLKAGQPLDLPAAPKDSQQEMARLENLLMRQGQAPPVMDYDLMPVHLPIHRGAEDEARAAGDLELLTRIIRHVQQHIQVAQQNAAQLQAQQQQAAAPSPAPFQPFPREPQPQLIAGDFSRLSGGQ